MAPFELVGLLLQSFAFLVVLTKHPLDTIFFQLAAELTVKSKLFTVFHSETDEQTERANQNIEK